MTDASLEVIAEEWRESADALARFAMRSLVNRIDVWGAYLPVARRRVIDGRLQSFVTAPFGRARGKETLTHGLLVKHFVGRDQGHLVSLHATSPERTSRWLAVDLDVHDPEAEEAPVQAAANRNAALAWADTLASLGFDPLVFDSNGAGGLHVWAIFEEPADTAFAQELVLGLVSDWARFGLTRRPEVWPKGEPGDVRDDDDEGGTGGCLRLPGRHHSRAHWTRVFSGEPELDEPWLAGRSAARRILDVRLAKIASVRSARAKAPAPIVAAASPSRAPAEGEVRGPRPPRRRGRKPTVCVDLDGVLAAYDGWKGLDFIGEPLPGAVELTRELSVFSDVVVYTTRTQVEANLEELREKRELPWDAPPETLRTMLPAFLAQKVRYWLEKHGFRFAGVWTGQGKPAASAYVDDRAVACRPQEDPKAFADAVAAARTLCGPRTTK